MVGSAVVTSGCSIFGDDQGRPSSDADVEFKLSVLTHLVEDGPIVKLQWDLEPASDKVTYTVWRAVDPSELFFAISFVGATSTTDLSVEWEKRYRYRVDANHIELGLVASTPPITVATGNGNRLQIFFDVAPATITNSTEARFFFSGNKEASYICNLDDIAWILCQSPEVITGLTEGGHTFRLQGVYNNQETDNVQWSWQIDLTPPDSVILSGPGNTIYDTGATFEFFATEKARLECRVDGGAWKACTSPLEVDGLAAGEHTFAVRAIDLAGNRQPEPAVWTWQSQLPAWSIKPTSAAIRGLDWIPDTGIVVTGADGKVRVFDSAGAPIRTTHIGGSSGGGAIADIDGDGRTELVVGTDGPNQIVAVDLGNGSIDWVQPVTHRVDAAPAVARINGSWLVIGQSLADPGPVAMPVSAFSLAGTNGSLMWAVEIGAGGPGGAAIGAGAAVTPVVVGGRDNILRSLRLVDGVQTWQLDLGTDLDAGPVIAAGPSAADTAIVAGRNGLVAAVAMDTGTAQWSRIVDSHGYRFGPALGDVAGLAGTDVVIASEAGQLAAIDVTSGTVAWQRELSGPTAGSPILVDLTDDDRPDILVPVGDKLYAVSGTDGVVQWSFATTGTISVPPVAGAVDGGTEMQILVATDQGWIYLLPTGWDWPQSVTAAPWVRSRGGFHRQGRSGSE